jgi:hypothetical protein
MSFMTRCSPVHLTPRFNQTSSGMDSNNSVFDRETGESIVIHYPSFGITSDPFVSFRNEGRNSDYGKMLLLLKCLVIIASLPEAALEETVEELEGISRFYVNRLPSDELPVIAPSTIKGKLGNAKVRPPIVLEI